MLFDFRTFARIASNVHTASDYTLQDELKVFRYYYETYERAVKKPHPSIRQEQIRKIMLLMPCMYVRAINTDVELCVEEYKMMIDKHFNTPYKKCNYNINHFFSGRIREMRWLEVCQ